MAIIVPIVSAWNPAGLNKALADIRKAEGSLNKFAAGTQSIGKQMQSVGMSLSTKVTLPLTLMGAASIRTAADFEVAMAQVAVATDTPVSGLKSLSDLAKQLGADTIFSANESAQAMLELAKAGIKPAEIQAGALANTLDLAAASGMGLAESAVVMSAGMNTFNLGAKDSTKIVDALAGAANASAADVADIAMALQQTGQQAVASGLTIQETTAALAAFADAGVRGSDAGTSFKTFLQRLNPVSAEAASTMKQLGIEFFDSSGNMKDLAGIAEEVQAGFQGLSQEQRLAAMQTIFGSDALRAANILYEEGSAGISQYIDATNKSGAAAKMAEARNSGLSGSLEAMRGSIETAALVIGESLSPTIKKMAERIQSMANSFSQLSPAVQGTIVKIALIAAVIGPAVLILGAMVTAFGNIAVAIRTVIALTSALKVQTILMGTAYTQAGIAGVLAMRAIKIAMVTTGIGALIVGLGYLTEKLLSTKLAADKTARSLAEVTRAESVSKKFATGWRNDVKASNDLRKELDKLGGSTKTYSDSTGGASKASKKASEAASILKDKISNLNQELKNGNTQLEQAQTAFEEYKKSIKSNITGILNFGNAQNQSTQLAEKAANAQENLAEASKQYQETLKTGTIKDQQDALENLRKAEQDAATSISSRKSFLQILQDQAAQASTFSGKVQQLITMGLSETAIGQVLAAGADAGTAIADEIIAGGATVVTKVNDLVTATDDVAKQLADAMPAEFFKAGVTAGQALVDGVKAAIAASGLSINVSGDVVNQAGIDQVNAAIAKAKTKKSPGKGDITKKERKSIMDLAASLGVEVPAFAKGGIVTGPTFALIGEAGPEAVIPLSGNNAGMGATYNINVNAGMGADGAVIGREIVDAIKKYERASGPVFASA